MLRNEKYTGRVLLQKLSVLALFKSKIKASWIGISILTLIRPLFLTRCSWQCSKRNSAALENRKTKLPWGSRFDIMKKTAGGRVNTKGDWDSSHARSLFDRTASSSCSRLLPSQYRAGGVDQQYRIAGAALFTADFRKPSLGKRRNIFGKNHRLESERTAWVPPDDSTVPQKENWPDPDKVH